MSESVANLENPRRHPDLFSEVEAAVYLCLEGPRSLEWVRENFGLQHYTFGRKVVYHRRDLDLAADRMTGRDTKCKSSA